MRQTACQLLNPIMVDGYTLIFNCTTMGQTSGTILIFYSNGLEHDDMSHITRKHFFGASAQVRLKPACSVKEARVLKFWI